MSVVKIVASQFCGETDKVNLFNSLSYTKMSVVFSIMFDRVGGDA